MNKMEKDCDTTLYLALNIFIIRYCDSFGDNKIDSAMLMSNVMCFAIDVMCKCNDSFGKEGVIKDLKQFEEMCLKRWDHYEKTRNK